MSNFPLMDLVKTHLLAPLVGLQCAEKLADLQLSAHCLKLLVSKGLSIGILLGSVLVKLPQILKIVAHKSAKGLSLAGLLLESLAIFIGLAYNFHLNSPFSTYGEGTFLVLQNIIIMSLMLSYSKSYMSLCLILFSTAAFVYSLYDQSVISMATLAQLQFSSIFIGMASKFPQIYTNFAAGSTGQLSFISCFLQFAGAAARVFTTLQEVPDVMVLYGIMSAALLNGIVVAQIFTLGGDKKVVSSKKSKVKTK